MKQTPIIHLPVKHLRTALIGLSKVLARKPTLSALACIRFEADNPETVTLTGTDLDTWLKLEIPAEVKGNVQSPFLVPLSDLKESLKGCQANDQLTLEPKGNEHVNLTKIVGTGAVTHSVTTPPVSDFPALPEIKTTPFELKADTREALLQALACSSADPTRYILNGACIDGGNTIVGTDGRHLYRANSMKLPVKNAVILPYRKVLDWKPLQNSETWRLAIESPWFQLAGEAWQITGKVIEGNYPNWRQVMPPDKDYRSSAILNPVNLKDLATAILNLPGGKERNKPVGLQLDAQGLTLLANGGEDAPVAELPIPEATIKGPAVTVSLNRDYLAKALSFGLNRLDVIDEKSPVRFRSGDTDGCDLIVMPVRTTEHSQPRNPKPPKPTPMKTNSNNGGTNGRHKPEDTGELTPLESATTHIINTKGLLRQAVSELTELGNVLKQVKTDQKNTEKEFRQVRSTIRSLQKVEL